MLINIRIIILATFLLFSIQSLYSKENNLLVSLNNLSVKEMVFVHTDRDIYIAGETIFFKIYLFNDAADYDNKASRVVYLALRDVNQQRIIESRIWLENDTGFGKIFIPDTLSSGLYQLVAFTNWMRLDYEMVRFRKEVFIANRFDNESFIKGDSSELIDSLYSENSFKTRNKLFEDSSLNINLSLTDNKYKPRSKVILNTTFTSNIVDDSLADFSISVIDLNSIFKYNFNSIEESYAVYKNLKLGEIGGECSDVIENEGIIISGSVVNARNIGIENKVVYLSTPDTIVNLQYSTTDKLGRFNFMLSNYYEGKSLFIGLMNNENIDEYKIIVHDKYDFSSKYLPSTSLKIQSSYIKKSQDICTVNKSFDKKNSNNSFSCFNYYYRPVLYSKPDYSVNITDFSFLNQLDIILQETLHGVKVNKKINTVSIIDPQLNLSYNKPMIFLDGVPFFNFSEILSYSSDKIKRLEVISSTWVMDNLLFRGILSIFTNKFEIYNFKNLNRQIIIHAGSFLPRTEFISPDYSNDSMHDNKPDFRQLLYWKPQLQLKRNETKSIEFFTGDLCSEYLIKVHGISSKGLPISSYKIIRVEK